jgi:hypothetical protein
VKLFTGLCLLFMIWLSIAQASHHHGLWPGQSAQAQSVSADHPASPKGYQDNEETCQLCIAMHSALPGIFRFAVILGVLLAVLLLERTEQPIVSFWSFSLFSRPPPCSL